MNKKDALALLKKAPTGDKPSRVNKDLTMDYVVLLVTNWVKGLEKNEEVTGLMEKRVWQVSKNQIRPRYKRGT